MKVQYTDYVDVLYIPEAGKPRLADLMAMETGDPKRPFRIDVTNNVRNRDGYRTRLQRDIMSLRGVGAIIDVVPNAEGKKLIAEGKIDPKTHVARKTGSVSVLMPSKAKGRSDQVV